MANPNREYDEMELQKKRLEILGYGFFNIPIDLDHKEHLVSKATEDGAENAECTTSTTCPAETTAPAKRNKPPPSTVLKPGQDSTESKKSLAIRPSDPTILEIQVHWAERNKFEVFPVKLDTGCDEDWISQAICDKLKLETQEVSPKEYVLFNNKTFESSRVTELHWFAPNGLKGQFTTFRVVEDANFDVLLGKNTLLGLELIEIKSNRAGVLTKKKISKEDEQKIKKNAAKVEKESKDLATARKQASKRPATPSMSSKTQHDGKRR